MLRPRATIFASRSYRLTILEKVRVGGVSDVVDPVTTAHRELAVDDHKRRRGTVVLLGDDNVLTFEAYQLLDGGLYSDLVSLGDERDPPLRTFGFLQQTSFLWVDPLGDTENGGDVLSFHARNTRWGQPRHRPQ